MLITGITRLGRDAELRYLPDGTAVINLALAFNYGAKAADGTRPTQWIDAALFGKRAEALKPHLLKGSTIGVTLSDPHIETFARRDGTRGEKLVGRILDLEFAGGQRPTQDAAPPASQTQPAPAATNATSAAGFADFDDDVPF
jgi:single-strand DNA-binding protein